METPGGNLRGRGGEPARLGAMRQTLVVVGGDKKRGAGRNNRAGEGGEVGVGRETCVQCSICPLLTAPAKSVLKYRCFPVLLGRGSPLGDRILGSAPQ